MNLPAEKGRNCALLVVASLAVLLGLVNSCSGRNSSIPDTSVLAGPPPAPVQLTGIAEALGSPRSLQAIGNNAVFRQRCRGSEFAPDLPFNLSAAVKYSAQLAPSAQSAAGLSGTAYCIYRLRCFRQAETASLELRWKTTPDPGTCWIALSSWQRESWQLLPLPAGNVVELDAADFASEDHKGYVGVIITGDNPADLLSLSCNCAPDGTVPYNLFTPLSSTDTYLMDMQGEFMHTWQCNVPPGVCVYLLDNGHILRMRDWDTGWPLSFGGASDGIDEYDWEGNLVWSCDFTDTGINSHHDIQPLPNGNILLISWQRFTRQQAIGLGRDPSKLNGFQMLVDSVLEVTPVGPDGFAVVWEWYLSDHLIQDFNPELPNYGDVALHPELVDLNFTTWGDSDWTHVNSIDYNEELDQIALSCYGTCELFVIDHSTTTEEAASHAGGGCGMGGDLLYRWGNPASYRAGTAEDKVLHHQHDVGWIPSDCPGAGNLLMFNNGGSDAVWYSTVVEIAPPLNPDGTYYIEGGAYAPARPDWEFFTDPPELMFSGAFSSAQRLRDGNTLICVGEEGLFLEVTPEGQIVWEYANMLPDPADKMVFRVDRYRLFEPWLELAP